MDIDFCNWFYGFFDGEGTFGATIQASKGRTPQPRAWLAIQLSGTDSETLNIISRNFGYGNVRPSIKMGMTGFYSNWQVSDLENIIKIFIPFFDNYPLRSKKGNEYPYWRELVLLLNEYKGNPDKPINRINELINSIREERTKEHKKVKI